MNDITSAFAGIRRNIANMDGVGYADFRATCRPNRSRANVDFAFSFCLFVSSLITSMFVYDGYVLVIPLSLMVGISFHKLSLFFHEAAHYNLCTSSPVLNDRVANGLIGIFLLDDIKNYRAVHLGHHRYFGQSNDPESSYQETLDVALIAQLLLGIRTVKVLLRRSRDVEHKSQEKNHIRTLGMILYGFLAIFIFIVRQDLIAGLMVFGGIFCIFPFIAGIRQLLEHRLPPGGITRNFAQSPLAPIFSGVGFSYHLYHHWDPQLHYTTLPKIHSYFLNTELKDQIMSVSSTYTSTMIKSWGVK